MAAQQILVLLVKVRILVEQQKTVGLTGGFSFKSPPYSTPQHSIKMSHSVAPFYFTGSTHYIAFPIGFYGYQLLVIY